MIESRNARWRTVVINALSSYATLLAGAAIGFVATPLLFHALGTVRFGLWSVLGSLAGYLALLELGLGVASWSQIASVEEEGPEAVAEVISTSMLLFLLVGIAAVGVTAVLTTLIGSIFHVPAGFHDTAKITFLVLGVAQAVNSVVSAYTAALVGTGRMYKSLLLGFGVSIVSVVLVTALAIAHAPLPCLGLVLLLAACLNLLVLRRQTLRDLSDVRPRLRLATRAAIRRLLSLGWRNAIQSLASVLAFGSDLVLIGVLVGVRAAAGYALALRGYGFAQKFTTGLSGAFGPTHSHQAATADAELRFRTLAGSMLVTLALALCCGLTLAAFGHGLLILWLGRLPHGTASVLLVFSGVLVLQTPGLVASSQIIGSQRADVAMRYTLISAAINVTASVVFTELFGIIGPALGSLTAVALVDSIYFPRVACELLGIPARRLLRELVAPLAVPTVGLIAILFVERFIAVSGPATVALAAVAAASYGGLLWITGAWTSLQRLRTG